VEGRLKKTRKEVLKKDCQTQQLNKKVAKDHSKWKKLTENIALYPQS